MVKKVFITGGTTGIGLSVACEYLKEGHIVGICGRDLSKLPMTIKDQYPNLKTYTVDVRKREELIAAVDDFASDGLDIVLANAGRSVGEKSTLPNFEISREVIEINVIGVLNTFEAALKHMSPKKKGHIAAVASVAGMVGLKGASSYSASKAAVIKLCEAYSLDLKAQGIDVTCICPGFIDTPLTQRNKHSMPWLMTAEEGGKKIKAALDKKDALFVFPWQMKTLMYFLDRMPRCLYRFLMNLEVFDYSKQK